MALDQTRMDDITRGLPTKSAKIRKLNDAGYKRTEIAKFLDIRYQHVRNVLVQDSRSQARAENRAQAPVSQKIQIDQNGRIVIPAQFRADMGVGEGDVLIARMEEGELRLMSADMAIRRAQDLVRKYVPENESLVEGLIRSRRDEVRREAENG